MNQNFLDSDWNRFTELILSQQLDESWFKKTNLFANFLEPNYWVKQNNSSVSKRSKNWLPNKSNHTSLIKECLITI